MEKIKKVALGLVVLGIVLIGVYVSIQLMMTIIIFIVLATFFIKGLAIVHQEERMVVEFFGSFYKTKKPGLRWNFLYVVTARAFVPIWEQTLTLFGEPIKIDFKDGSATPKNVEAFVRVKKPDNPYNLPGEEEKRDGVYRVIYHVDNWRKRTTELLENAVRSYLATLTIDEALTRQRGGYDLLGANRIPSTEKNKIKKALERWGLDLLRVTVTDFDLEPDLVKARGEVHKRKRAVEAAEQERKVRAFETTGALIQMIAESTGKSPEEIQQEINSDPELKKSFMSFSEELITRQMSIDGKALTDIRIQGGGDIQGLLTLIAAAKAIPASKKESKKESKEEE